MNSTPTEHGGVILIVDDMQQNLQVLGGILTPLHFEVMMANNGTAALQRAAVRRPDLILLDLMMPGMDGMEVCRRLKADPKTADVPVIFLTAADESGLAARAIGTGAVDYVNKPFNTTELLARVRTHVALKRTRDELHQIIAQKNELMSGMAHDLKNPVSTVRFSALMLREQGLNDDDPRGELIDGIIESCDGALEFINHRLEQSARTAQMEQPVIEDVDVIEVLNFVLLQNLPIASRKDIKLEVDFPENENFTVRADHRGLNRVLSNLISNAIKFSPAASLVTIAVERKPETGVVRVAIQDQGPGLQAEDHEHLYTAYRRLSAKPTGGESSTGLGLSIVHGLLKKMNGTIGCESQPGAGACFWFTLPIA